MLTDFQASVFYSSLCQQRFYPSYLWVFFDPQKPLVNLRSEIACSSDSKFIDDVINDRLELTLETGCESNHSLEVIYAFI